MSKPTTLEIWKRCAILACMLSLYATDLQADTITIGGRSQSGSFLGYVDGQFHFESETQGRLSKKRIYVRELTLDPPRTVRIEQTKPNGTATGALATYTASTFQLVGGPSIPGMRVLSIRVQAPIAAERTAASSDGRSDTRLDTRALQSRSDLSAAQTTALNDYLRADDAYRGFVQESSAMVAGLDGLTGRRRDQLLAALRDRKVEEQPFRRALADARAALLAAAPQPWRTPSPKAAGADEGEVAVAIMDLTPLRNGDPPPTTAQSTALDRYTTASDVFLALTRNASATQQALQAAASALRSAEAAVMRAYPELEIATP